MNYKRLKCNTVAAEDDVFSALCGQLSSIKNVINELVRKRENRETFDKGSKSGFKFTKQEIKAMPNYIKKIFIANNYIVNYRITSNGYYEARIRRKNMYIEASGRDFETMRKRFMDRLTSYYDRSDETSQQQIKEVNLPITPKNGLKSKNKRRNRLLIKSTKGLIAWIYPRLLQSVL